MRLTYTFVASLAERSDYDLLSNDVTLSDTATQQCVSLVIVDDSVLEDTESLTVSLSLLGKENSVSLSLPTATLFITDDDSERFRGHLQMNIVSNQSNQRGFSHDFFKINSDCSGKISVFMLMSAMIGKSGLLL